MSQFTRRLARAAWPQPLIFDGRFTTKGVYSSVNGGFGGIPPAPYSNAEFVPSGSSNITVYDVDRKGQPWWPDPYSPWSPLAGAFTSYNDNTNTTARAQCEGGWHYKSGDDFYISWVVYIPSILGNTWPMLGSSTDWNVVGQFHAPPWNGSPIIQISVAYVNSVLCLTGEDGQGYAMWYAPLTMDKWTKVTLHVRISTVGGQGMLQVWVDGVALQMTLPGRHTNYDNTNESVSDDGKTLYIATELMDTNGPGAVYMNSYRKGIESLFGVGEVVFFHAGQKIGTTFASVQ